MLLTNTKQTDKQTDSKIQPTPTDIVGMGNNFIMRACVVV